MDITATGASAAPWLVVGVLLAGAAVLIGVLAASLFPRSRARRDHETPPDAGDDLPGFLESPPGTAPRSLPGGGMVALAAPPPPTAPPGPRRRNAAPGPVAIAALAVLLLVAAAVVALVSAGGPRGGDGRTERSSGPGPGHPDGVAAELTFAGLVLERRAVGVTVTYPEVELTSDREGTVALLTLPTWNCLSAEAPEDPEAAGCVPGRTEFAELREPALEVTGSGGEVRLVGAFATSTRPTGGTPEPTGRTYRIEVSVTAGEEAAPGRWSPADGVLLLEDREASTVEGRMRIAR